MRPIAFDIDGVLANFIRSFTRIGTRLFGTPASDTPAQDNWVFENMPSLGLTKEQVGHPIRGGGMWGEVIKSPYFWANLDPINVSIMFTIDRIKNKMFITNRFGIDCKEQTIAFLERWGIIEPDVVVSGDKGPIAKERNISALIDDYYQNCADIQTAVPDAYVSMLIVPYNRIWRPGALATPGKTWFGPIALSVEHFVQECDKRRLIEWTDKGSFNVGSEASIKSEIKLELEDLTTP